MLVTSGLVRLVIEWALNWHISFYELQSVNLFFRIFCNMNSTYLQTCIINAQLTVSGAIGFHESLVTAL